MSRQKKVDLDSMSLEELKFSLKKGVKDNLINNIADLEQSLRNHKKNRKDEILLVQELSEKIFLLDFQQKTVAEADAIQTKITPVITTFKENLNKCTMTRKLMNTLYEGAEVGSPPSRTVSASAAKSLKNTEYKQRD